MIGLIAAAYVGFSQKGGLGDQLFVMAVFAIVVTPLLFFITLSMLREPSLPDESEAEVAQLSQLKLIWRNGPFRGLLLISFVLLATEYGANAVKALILEHVFVRPDLFAPLLLAELVVMVLSIPFWLWLSRRYSKHQAVGVAAVWGGLVSLMIPLVSGDSLIVFSLLSLMKAIAIGAVIVLINGMAADVIDIDQARTGKARTGVYFAFWGMVIKGAAAAGVLAGTNLPDLMGYRVLEEGVEGAWSLVLTYGLLPGLGFLAIAPVLFSWRLTRERQDRIRAAIQRRTERHAN